MLILSVLLLILTLSCSLTALAQESDGSGDFAETVPEEVSDLLEALPPELIDLLPPELFSSDSGEFGDAVKEISSFSFLLQSLLSAIGLRIGDCLRLLATVAGLLLLSSVFSTLRRSVRSESVGRAFSFCASLSILAAIPMQGYGVMEEVSTYFSTLNHITGAALPLMGALYAMGGNVTAAAASAGSLTVYMTLLEQIVGRSIIPFCGICLSFALISAVDGGARLGSLAGTVKKQYTTALAFLMMLLLAMLAAQTTLGARADTLAMRSVKFAAGNLIPVVGGSVSELLRTVSSGVGYLRGTVGVCGVILLILLLLPTLVSLLLYRFVWQICASLADMLGCDGERRLLEEIASLSGYLIAAVSICSSVLLLSFSLLTHCASAIG